MPRGSRVDATNAVHHIMVRGIERRKIFNGDMDRDHFLHRLGEILQDTGTTCFAWSLMPNHFHLLLRTSSIPISTVM
ncbi:MAG: transposase, partial [Bacteroidaceae bacterium]|nr:transposase [Bacteroidaceae bacterium]